jgi:hypothetical protein
MSSVTPGMNTGTHASLAFQHAGAQISFSDTAARYRPGRSTPTSVHEIVEPRSRSDEYLLSYFKASLRRPSHNQSRLLLA